MGKQKKNDGSIPDSVIHQLGEHAIGGFLLFYFNSQNGQPDQVMSFDSPAHCLALQKYVEDWDNALQQVSHNHAVENIQQNLERMNGHDDDSENS